jgi:alkyl hydroperoxide reductase subunit AhpC
MPSISNLGAEFPNLAVETQIGPLNVWDYQADSWLILFSHPKDYTPGAFSS